MRVGGKSNISIRNRTRANREDRKAWAINGLEAAWYTLYLKPLSKLIQYVNLRAPIRMREKNVLAIILARGVSKGILGKKIRQFVEKPLSVHSIEASGSMLRAPEPGNPSRVDVTSQEIDIESANVMMSELKRTCRLA